MRMVGTPSSEIAIDASLVFRLLAEQHPDLQNLPIQFMDEGWDNAMFRLGDRLAARVPRRALGATLLANEQTWLPHLARQLPIAVSAPQRIGRPNSFYPWHWSVVPWLPGHTADTLPLNENHAQQFAEFLRALHVPAPENAPRNPFRGVPLSQRATALTERLQRVAGQILPLMPMVRSLWQQALAAPLDVEITWIHGDLHPRNILVNPHRITGIIDWGDLTAGDRATDLASLWSLFPDQSLRKHVIDAYCVAPNHDLSPATLARAKGWAILFGITLLDSGLIDHPQHATIGQQILQCVTHCSI